MPFIISLSLALVALLCLSPSTFAGPRFLKQQGPSGVPIFLCPRQPMSWRVVLNIHSIKLAPQCFKVGRTKKCFRAIIKQPALVLMSHHHSDRTLCCRKGKHRFCPLRSCAHLGEENIHLRQPPLLAKTASNMLQK